MTRDIKGRRAHRLGMTCGGGIPNEATRSGPVPLAEVTDLETNMVAPMETEMRDRAVHIIPISARMAETPMLLSIRHQ